MILPELPSVYLLGDKVFPLFKRKFAFNTTQGLVNTFPSNISPPYIFIKPLQLVNFSRKFEFKWNLKKLTQTVSFTVTVFNIKHQGSLQKKTKKALNPTPFFPIKFKLELLKSYNSQSLTNMGIIRILKINLIF